MSKLDKKLVSFCDTQRQKEIIECALEGNSYSQIADIFKINKRSVERIIKRIKDHAAVKGYSPQHDMIHECPDPFITKGVSTLYDKEGEIAAQWVKTVIDQDKLNDYVKATVESALETIKPVHVPKPIKFGTTDLLTVYPIADLHLGMYAWSEETGADYNIDLAEKILTRIFSELVERAPKSRDCLIVQLGDFLHCDNLQNETARSGNTLDVDTRYAKIYRVAMRMIRYCIETAARKHHNVHVINCMGNHDDVGATIMTVALDNIYANTKRIHVLNSPAPRQYFRFGNTLIGATHGNDISMKDLPLIMASEKAKDWGDTDHHYWYTGHWHNDKQIESGNCKVESFRTIASKDAWANSKGYLSGRDMKCLVIDKDLGETQRYRFSVDPKLFSK